MGGNSDKTNREHGIPRLLFSFFFEEPKKAEKFYKEIFGWRVKPEQVGSDTFNILKMNNHDIGFLEKKGDGPEKQGTIIYIAVESVKKTFSEAIAAGSVALVSPFTLGDKKTEIAIFQDPFGYKIGIYSEVKE